MASFMSSQNTNHFKIVRGTVRGSHSDIRQEVPRILYALPYRTRNSTGPRNQQLACGVYENVCHHVRPFSPRRTTQSDIHLPRPGHDCNPQRGG